MKILDNQGHVLTEFHANEHEGKFTINRVQDVEPIVEMNKALQSSGGKFGDESMRLVGRIPLVVLEEWQKQNPNMYRDKDWLLARIDEYHAFRATATKVHRREGLQKRRANLIKRINDH